MKEKIKIVEFTDPVCTWCWGSEPILRKLEVRYGNQLEVSFIMGGLVKDITGFYDRYNDIGGDPERSNQQIAKHWLEASARHGMPVKAEGFKMFSQEHTSTYPQNIAYKAAQMQDEKMAKKFLRRIREASAAEAKQTNTTEILLELASEVGLDIATFLSDYTNGKAKNAFEEDLYTTAQYQANGFPSFMIEYNGKKTMLRGYQRYESFRAIIDSLSSGEIKEYPINANEEEILNFIAKYGSVAPIEIQTVFDLSVEEVENIIYNLSEKQKITKRSAGNGYFIGLKLNPMECDSSDSACRIS